MVETWLYIMTRRQSNIQWSGGIAAHPAPKKFWVQNPPEKFSPQFFRIKTASLLIDYLPKGQTISLEHYSSLLVQLKDILKEKRRGAGRSPRGSCSCTKMLRLTEHLQPRRHWPTWASNFLITHSILRICPHLTTTSSLDWKKTIERPPYLVRRGGHCCRWDLVGRTIFWTSFWVACKS